MDSSSLDSKKGPIGGAVLHIYKEAQETRGQRRQKRKMGGGEEVRKRPRVEAWEENKDSGLDLQRSSSLNPNGRCKQTRIQTRTTRTRTRTSDRVAPTVAVRCGLRSQRDMQDGKPEVKEALIRRTQNSVRTRTQILVQSSTEFSQSENAQVDLAKHQAEPGLTDNLKDPKRTPQNGLRKTAFEVRSTATKQSSDTRTRTPEKRERGLPGTRAGRKRKIHPSVFRGRGQLRLSVIPEAERLVVHIHEARGLMGKSSWSCDSHVKLAVTSDLCTRSTKTKTVPNNKNPKYNARFTLCVTQQSVFRRLLVSVFRRSADTRCCQLIGCMSFGIGSLVSTSKLVNGWFYLLREDYGQWKHLRVPSERSGPMRNRKEAKADLRRTPDSFPDPDLNDAASSASSTRPPSLMTSTLPISSSTHSSSVMTSTLSSSSATRPSSVMTSTLPVSSSTRPSSVSTSTLPSSSSSGLKVAMFPLSSRLTVSIVRGNDGYGFTICSDCPVRVQAVDPGGPAHLSGLCRGDFVLQLNGIPVETSKCADLAQAIRSCPSQIIMVVWRGLPEVRSGGGAWPHQLLHNKASCRKSLPPSSHGKHSCRRGQGAGVWSSLGVLGSLRKSRAEAWEEGEDEREKENAAQTATIKGTRVTSVMGDDYIILSPLSSGGQHLRPVYQERHETLGDPYQTHPSRGQHLALDSQPILLNRPVAGCIPAFPPPTSCSSGLPVNYHNYQNCTIVQSHRSSSEQEGYATLVPKTVIFPIFVQPIDLCSPDRSLLMSEEMILHQTDSQPTKVTVLIYTDLLLLTREDEFGRCHVLQAPLHLNTLQLREVSTEPLHLYLVQTCASRWRSVLGLEAFSFKQKVEVCLCLRDSIQLQLLAETGHGHQPLDLPSDPGLPTFGQPDLLYSASSPYSPESPFSPPSPPPPSSLPRLCRTATFPFHLSPVWKERGKGDEEEERQQGEGESASETSESVGGVRRQSLLSVSPSLKLNEDICAEDQLSYRPQVLRRSLSEGSLLREPRSPQFHSDSTIHRLLRPTAFDLVLTPAPRPPSPGTLKKQLTREGGSLHHMLLLLNGTKRSEVKDPQFRKKTKSLAADVCSRLAFLRRRKVTASIHGNSLEKALRNNRPSTEEVLKWAEGLEVLLANQYGVAVFRHFLRSEFSEENLDFWLAVERFKRTHPLSKMAALGKKIYEDFISTEAVRQVNVDSSVRDLTHQSLDLGVSRVSFHLAQLQVFSLMESDSYPRFLKSRLYAQFANDNAQAPSHTADGIRCADQTTRVREGSD